MNGRTIARSSTIDTTIGADMAGKRNPGGDSGYITESVLALRTCFTRVHTTTPRCVLPCVKFDNLAVATRFESIRRK